MPSAREAVELFHLCLVKALFSGLPDATRIAIKGGINLRFYFQSVRFSEDLDLDVQTIAKETLENRIDKLLKSPQLLAPLKARGLSVKDVSKPKQTETVQRWKVRIATEDLSIDEHTKVEFSRRDDIDDAELERIDPGVAAKYLVQPYLATHYMVPAAVRQKIRALRDRAITQPRDVFDLGVLFARPDAPPTLDDEAKAWLEDAIANAMKLTFEQYRALVVAFLEPEHAEDYGTEAFWESMVLDVVQRLEAYK